MHPALRAVISEDVQANRQNETISRSSMQTDTWDTTQLLGSNSTFAELGFQYQTA